MNSEASRDLEKDHEKSRKIALDGLLLEWRTKGEHALAEGGLLNPVARKSEASFREGFLQH